MSFAMRVPSQLLYFPRAVALKRVTYSFSIIFACDCRRWVCRNNVSRGRFSRGGSLFEPRNDHHSQKCRWWGDVTTPGFTLIWGSERCDVSYPRWNKMLLKRYQIWDFKTSLRRLASTSSHRNHRFCSQCCGLPDRFQRQNLTEYCEPWCRT